MNEEILEYLRGQFGDDYFNIDTQEALTDYENTVLRRGIMAGYDLGELQPALEQLRVELVKKKESQQEVFQSSQDLYQQAVEETGFSKSEDSPYAGGLGYDYSGTRTLEKLDGSAAEQKVANDELDALAKDVENAQYDQAYQTFKYLGYSDEKASESVGNLHNMAIEQGQPIGQVMDNLYLMDFRTGFEQYKDDLNVENADRYRTIVDFGSAAQEATNVAYWLDKGVDIDGASEELGISIKSHDVFHEDYLTPGEDYFSFWLIDEESAPGENTGAYNDLKRFYNRAAISKMQADMLDPLMPLSEVDFERLAYYQKLMRENHQVEWDTDNAFLEGIDIVLSSVVSPIFESAAAMWAGAATNPLTYMGALTGAGTFVGFGAEGLALEYSSKVLEVFNELGYDTAKPAELAKAFENPEVMKEARTRGLAKGIPIAIVDMISAGTASAVYKSIIKQGYRRFTTYALAEGAEGLMGAGGEALGQLVETGEIYDVKGIALEFLGQGIQTAPIKAYTAIKNKDMSQAEIDYLRFAVLNKDAHELTTAASSMNFNEVQAINKKIKEQRQAARKAKSKEARATHRQNARQLQQQKYETLNRNLETLQNLPENKRKKVVELTQRMNDHAIELKRFKKGDPGRSAVIEEIGKIYGQINDIVKGRKPRETPMGSEVAPNVNPTPVDGVTPVPGAPTVEEAPTPTITELDGQQAVVKLPSGITRGLVTIDEGGKVAITDAKGNVTELGNVQDIGEQSLEEAGFGSFLSELNEDGSFSIRGKQYTAPRGKKSVNLNENGEVVSVTLKDSKGRNRTFRGEVAQEIAYLFSQPQSKQEDTRSIEEIIVETSEEASGGPAVETVEEVQGQDETVTPSDETPPIPQEEKPKLPKPALSSPVRTISPRNGISERVASTVNNLVSALSGNIGKDVRMVFWNNTEDLNNALGQNGLEAWYDFRTNTIHLTIDATDAVIREEFAHAGFGGIMSDNKVRGRLYQEVSDLAKKNDVLGVDVEAIEKAYREWGKSVGLSEAAIEAMVQEEVVMKVLASYTTNLNQIDASLIGKIRRIINKALTAVGFKKLTITDDVSLVKLAETFALATRQGKAIRQRVSQPYRTEPVSDGGRASILMLADALGLDAKTIQQFKGGYGEAFSFKAQDFLKRRDIGYATIEEAREALGEVDDVSLLPNVKEVKDALGYTDEDIELGMGAMATEVFDVASQSLEDGKTYNIETYIDYSQYKLETDLSIKGKKLDGSPSSRNLRLPIVTGGFFMPRTAEEYVEAQEKGTINRFFPKDTFDKLSPGEQLPPRFFALMPDRGTTVRRSTNTGGEGRLGGTDGVRKDQFLAEEVLGLSSEIHKEILLQGIMQSPMILIGDDSVLLGIYENGDLIGRVYADDIDAYLDGDPSFLLDEDAVFEDIVMSSAPLKGMPMEALDVYMRGVEEGRQREDVSDLLNQAEYQQLLIQMHPDNIGWIPGLGTYNGNIYSATYEDAARIYQAVLEKEINNGNIAGSLKEASRIAKQLIRKSLMPLGDILYARELYKDSYGVEPSQVESIEELAGFLDTKRMSEFDEGMIQIMFDLIDLGAPMVRLDSIAFLDNNENSESVEPLLEDFQYSERTRPQGKTTFVNIDDIEYKAYTRNFGSDVTWYLAGGRVPQTMNELLADADNIADPLERINYLSYMTEHIVNLAGDIDAEIDNKLFQQKVKEKIDSSRDELLSGRAALNQESIDKLKEGIVAGKRVGQGIASSRGVSTDVSDMSASSVRSIPAANRNVRPIYVEHAIALTSTERHPIMADQEVPPFIDNMPKEDYSREGMLTLYHGGYGLENISNDRPLYISPEESEAADYQRLQDAEEKSNPKLVNPVYIEESRVASQDQALEVARRLFPEKMAQYDATSDAMFFMLIDAEGMEARDFSLEDIPFILDQKERKKYFDALESAGFDAVSFMDQQADQTRSPRLVENMVVLNPQTAMDNGSMKLQSQKEWADGIYATFKERVVSNLLYLHDLADPEVREYMRRWYDGANKIAKDMSTKYGISVEQASGILAALSPGADWFINIQNAYNILEVLHNNQDSTFDETMYNMAIERKLESYRQTGPNNSYYKKKFKGKKMTPSKLLKKDRVGFDSFQESIDILRGRTLSGMDALEKAKFIRYYREVYMPSTVQVYNPVGDDLGTYTKKSGQPRQVVTQSFSNMAKAVTMFENNDIAMISELLGGSHKIRHFYNNIANPDATDGDVTMDTHAVAAAELMPYGQSSPAVNENFGGAGIMSSSVNGLSGNYWAYLDAYVEAANQRGILPREMQSITWEVIRLMMPSTLRDNTSRLDVAEIYKGYEGESIEDVQNEIKKYFDEKDTDTETPRGTNIKHPSWYRPSSGEGDITQGETSNEGDLAGGDLSSGTSTATDTPGSPSNDTGRAALKMRQATTQFVDMLKGGVPQEVAFAETILKADRKAKKGKLKPTDEGSDFFYEPQSINATREQLMGMSTAEIVSMLDTNVLRDISTQAGKIDFSTDGNILVLAQIEYLERLRKEGDMNGYETELAKLTQMGTTFGQLLRQFGEIKGRTVEGMVSLIAKEYERKGTPLKQDALETLTQAVEEYMQAKDGFDQAVDEVFDTDPSNFDQMDKKVQEAQERLEKAIAGINDFQKFNAPTWGTLLSTIMQGNLLTLRSITTNVIANAITLPMRLGEQLIAAPIEFMLSGNKREIRPSFGAMIYGAQRSFYGLKEAYKSIKSGVAPGDFEYTAGYQLRPLVALATVFGKGKEGLPQEFHSQADFMNYKAKKLVEGIFGLTAASNFKLLVLGDRPFYRGMEGYELYQQGRKLGLSGESLAQFLKYPTEEHLRIAREKGLKLTFQENDSTLLFGMVNTQQAQNFFSGAGGKMMESDKLMTRMFGNAVRFIVKSNVPFVKTPFNILSQSLELTMFPITFLQAFSRGMSARDRSEKLATALMGYMLFLLARRLYDQGAASGAVDKMSPKSRSVAYEVEPPFTINVSALGRETGEPFQPSDRRVGFAKLGLPGAILAAYVEAFKIIDRKPNFSSEEELKEFGIEEQSPVSSFLEKSMGITLGSLGALLDQSFLTGLENITKVLQNTEDVNVVTKYFEQLSRAMVSVPLPNMFTSFYRAEREFLPDYRDNTIDKRFKNVLYDRTFGTFGRGDNPAPIRINVWGEKINQTPPGTNPVFYEFLDPTGTRLATDDPLKVELYSLYRRTNDENALPSIPSIILNKELFRNKGSERYEFTTSEVNELLMLLGQERTKSLRAVVESEGWSRMSDESQIAVIKKINSRFSKGYQKLDDGSLKVYKWYRRRQQMIIQKKNEAN